MVLILSLLSQVTVAQSNPDDRYTIYRDGVVKENQFEEIQNTEKSIRTIFTDIGTVKTRSIIKSATNLQEEIYSYHRSGALETLEKPTEGFIIRYHQTGIRSNSIDLKPFAFENLSISNLILGVREEGNNKLYPEDVSIPSFDSAHNITGSYLFFAENREMGPYLKMNYQSGIVEGEIVALSEAGEKILQAKMKNGILNGEYVRFDAVSKEVIEKGTYVEGLINGSVFGYYPSGDKKFEVSFDNGILDGQVKFYSADGELKENCQFIKNLRTGHCQVFANNGIALLDENYSEGRRVKKWQENYEDGSIRKIANYSNGNLDGEVFSYSALGKIQKKEQYKKNMLNGTSYHYSENGILKASVEYKDNKKDGFVRIYYPGGKIEAEMPFRNGLKHGKQKRFYQSGEIFEVANYSGGRQVGISQSFYKTGVSMGGGMPTQGERLSYLDRAIRAN